MTTFQPQPVKGTNVTGSRCDNRMRLREAIAACAATGLLFSVVGCGSSGAAPSSGSTQAKVAVTPAIRVDGATISEQQIDALLAQDKATDAQTGQTFPAVGTAAYSSLRDQAARTLVDDQVVITAAATCGAPCRVSAAQAAAPISRLEAAGGQDVAKGLAQDGMSLAQAAQNARIALLTSRLAAYVAGPVRVTRAQALEYYLTHLSQYLVKGGPDLRQLVVGSQAKATAVEQKLTTANFARFAAEYSIDPTTRGNGGEVGPIAPGRVPTPLVSTVSALHPGQISAPVLVGADWYILQVRDLPAHITPFAQVEDSIIDAKVIAVQHARFAVWWKKTLARYEKHLRYLDSSLAPAVPAHRAARTKKPATHTAHA